ncbi:hypothetical protein MRX96_007499 [Rhipicephalus microplus]
MTPPKRSDNSTVIILLARIEDLSKAAEMSPQDSHSAVAPKHTKHATLAHSEQRANQRHFGSQSSNQKRGQTNGCDHGGSARRTIAFVSAPARSERALLRCWKNKKAFLFIGAKNLGDHKHRNLMRQITLRASGAPFFSRKSPVTRRRARSSFLRASLHVEQGKRAVDENEAPRTRE